MARTQPPATKPSGAGGTVYGTRGTSTRGTTYGTTGPRKTKPRWGRIALVVGGVVALIALLVAGCGIAYVTNLDEKLNRTDAFSGLGERPSKSVEGTQNILVLGSDSRDGGAYDPNAEPNSGEVKNERADTIMLLHIPADHSKAYIISIPRDTYVYVPELNGNGGTRAKINAAFAWGGIPLTVKTVENFTGVKIDHVAKIDFNGFKAMTEALGGVDVTVDKTVYDPRSKRTFKAGVNHLDGDAALDYVRQRYNLPRGDFDRVQRQQIFLRALMQKATDSGTLTNPVKLKKFLDAATTSLTVDNAFSLKDMALEFRGLRPGDLAFVTSPHLGSQTVDGQSVVVSDKEKAVELWSAVEKDNVADWLAANPGNNVTSGR
ncbi:LCP family protein [Cryptosporangium aurantiacum]|uniref:Transcriptional attenuator, LytR family n=1 Tax=Cryptosporangium aurantiacum TaxID=134849 RepID=A0A1M7RL30_9ACTN|nr:LCP family protein [Cryptosporangium aurantiacum]SHN46778.1 transcriptional attenuator, LytR family [Cryptosporangium aurantiacum]